MKLLRRFLVDELGRYRVNVRRGDNEYKITMNALRRYFERYVDADTATKCIISITASRYLDVLLAEAGLEVVYRRRGVYVVRRIRGDAHGRH